MRVSSLTKLHRYASRKLCSPFNGRCSVSSTSTKYPDFRALALHEGLVNNLRSTGITSPTQIQQKAIPKIFQNCDIVIAAETGSGKTLSYLLPLVQQLRLHSRTQEQPQSSPDCIILTTSQDLVRQIKSVLAQVDADFMKDHTAYVSSMSKISGGSNCPLKMIFSTPSALLRASKPKDFDFVRHIVVDEADMLLSGGAEKDTKLLLATIQNRARHSGNAIQYIFSAISFYLLKLPFAYYGRRSVRQFMEKKYPDIDFVETRHFQQLVPQLQASLYDLDEFAKPQPATFKDRCALLWDILANSSETAEQPRILIFANTVQSAEALQDFLANKKDYPCSVLHKKVDSFSRRQIVHQLTQNGNQNAIIPPDAPKTIICTDIASRGLDTLSVGHVIQFEFARDAISYIHRIGRTARAGHPGKGTRSSMMCLFGSS
uniref:ATP-dependent RNA helicase n=1 Tax=Albugo laibachii Nc14 TaxID=890382 RepID=F0WBT8_9STRA|nr:DEAD/DEAH box RNA helicase putative [Albugo laibachii Nc14]CCA20571.1 DEAD/DEAH box RNA helicase putative [Albugo laibachii Nc14]|eukprot:CCA20571.1 DEAD/DEAH box RNA helicase putative [Albugo laibachii Nc14]